VLCAAPASAQSVSRFSVDSAVSVNQFVGENAGDRPDIVVDITASARLGSGWVAYIRPWFRQASDDPYARSTEIYQAAVQYERSGRISTRVDLGYILSPIGLGLMDMRADTNPTILPHLSYLVPMPVFDKGAPRALPIAASYPLGGQVTASTTRWDARVALLASPPNRSFVLKAANPNPSSRPIVVFGGGITPKTGLRVGAGFATGEYARPGELTRLSLDGRGLKMLSVEGEWAFGYTKLSGELTHDSIETTTGTETADEWFLQGVHTLTPRWFVAGRHEGASAPPLRVGAVPPSRRTLRISEATVGFRLSPELTLRSSFVARQLYYSPIRDRQVGASLVWARRWW
jgi:hypothetical protein